MSGPSLLVKLLSGDSPAPDVQNVTEASPSLLTAHLTWPIALPFLTLCLPLVAPAPQDCVCLHAIGLLRLAALHWDDLIHPHVSVPSKYNESQIDVSDPTPSLSLDFIREIMEERYSVLDRRNNSRKVPSP